MRTARRTWCWSLLVRMTSKPDTWNYFSIVRIVNWKRNCQMSCNSEARRVLSIPPAWRSEMNLSVLDISYILLSPLQSSRMCLTRLRSKLLADSRICETGKCPLLVKSNVLLSAAKPTISIGPCVVCSKQMDSSGSWTSYKNRVETRRLGKAQETA